MSNIKQINPAIPGALRPIRAEDFQHLWDALNDTLAVGTDDTPRIIYGFDLVNDDELSSGAIAYKGQLYTYEYGDNVITLGTMIYGSTITGVDMRVFDDGSVYDFAFDKIVTTGYGDIPIGRVSPENLAKWKAPYIPDGYVKRSMIGAEAVDNVAMTKASAQARLFGSVSRLTSASSNIWGLLSYSTNTGLWTMPMIEYSGGTAGLMVRMYAPNSQLASIPERIPFKIKVSSNMGYVQFMSYTSSTSGGAGAAVLNINIPSSQCIIEGEFVKSHITDINNDQPYEVASYAMYTVV